MPDNFLAPARLNEKLGKLPIWAWGLIGGTGALAAYYLISARNKARTPNAGVNPAPGDQTLASVYTGMANPDLTANAALPVGDTGGTFQTTSALGNETLETNVTWLNRGVKIAVASGNTALGATQALQKYLGGKPLNTFEQDVITKALANLGYPPEGAPLLVKAIKDATPTPAKDTTPTKPATVITPVQPVAPSATVTAPKPTRPSIPAQPVAPAPQQPNLIQQGWNASPLKFFWDNSLGGRIFNPIFTPKKPKVVPPSAGIPASPTH